MILPSSPHLPTPRHVVLLINVISMASNVSRNAATAESVNYILELYKTLYGSVKKITCADRRGQLQSLRRNRKWKGFQKDPHDLPLVPSWKLKARWKWQNDKNGLEGSLIQGMCAVLSKVNGKLHKYPSPSLIVTSAQCGRDGKLLLGEKPVKTAADLHGFPMLTRTWRVANIFCALKKGTK